MKTKAVRMYGTRDLRLEEFELPEIKDDEILAKIITDSICMSTINSLNRARTTNELRRTSIPTRSSRAMNLPVSSSKSAKNGRTSLNRACALLSSRR